MSSATLTMFSGKNKSSLKQVDGLRRSPICCIIGHVGSGKTKLLDNMRGGTNVQEYEIGGITQQIGATYFPAKNINKRIEQLNTDAKLNVPGLLFLDTPGYEFFINLRARGSGLSDVAILVVDIMRGLETQTIESLLLMRNLNFIVALNKSDGTIFPGQREYNAQIDRLCGWKTCSNAPIMDALKQQSKDVQLEFNSRLTKVITEFKKNGLNAELYCRDYEICDTISIVPTSSISGEGVADLLLLLVKWAKMAVVQYLPYCGGIHCTVLEVKDTEGYGTTIDVVLVNGILHEGDKIVVCGMQGPIVTTIRALLTPQPMKELLVEGTFLQHMEIKAAQGIKIAAQGLDHTIAGAPLYVVGPDDNVDKLKESAMQCMRDVMDMIDINTCELGVYVQASSLGSLVALLQFLRTINMPVSGVGIGPVHKKDVIKASVMLEKKKKEFATILAFDVKVTQEARELADEAGVRIFVSDVIYRLFDQFKEYIDNFEEEMKREDSDKEVFLPWLLNILPNWVFIKKGLNCFGWFF